MLFNLFNIIYKFDLVLDFPNGFRKFDEASGFFELFFFGWLCWTSFDSKSGNDPGTRFELLFFVVIGLEATVLEVVGFEAVDLITEGAGESGKLPGILCCFESAFDAFLFGLTFDGGGIVERLVFCTISFGLVVVWLVIEGVGESGNVPGTRIGLIFFIVIAAGLEAVDLLRSINEGVGESGKLPGTFIRFESTFIGFDLTSDGDEIVERLFFCKISFAPEFDELKKCIDSIFRVKVWAGLGAVDLPWFINEGVGESEKLPGMWLRFEFVSAGNIEIPSREILVLVGFLAPSGSFVGGFFSFRKIRENASTCEIVAYKKQKKNQNYVN